MPVDETPQVPGPPPIPGAGPPSLPGDPTAEPTAESAEATAPASRGTLVSTCPRCGAQVAYAPGTTSMRCSSCNAEIEIAATDAVVREHSYDEWKAKNGDTVLATIGSQVLTCRNCGATTETTDLSGRCQFCSGALVAMDNPPGLVAPEAVVPFHVDQKKAQAAFGEWVGSRRFAPGALKKVGSTQGLTGTYVPHWTFDAQTSTEYTGQRGEHYYVTETRQVSDGKGGSRTESHQVQKTRWHRASGHVARFFDDVLVPGSLRVDTKKLAKMGPWKLNEAVPFQPEYLTGYSALRYDIDPQQGAGEARAKMRPVIEGDVRRDIGGDEQRVSDMDVTYSQAMFKLLLMPLWIASYLYSGKTFQVMVNANTGEVIGDRPYSVPKIIAAVVAALIVIGAIVAVVALTR